MAQKLTPWRAEADRFNPGEYVVKDRAGNVLASGFDSTAEAEAWIAERTDV